MLHDEACAVPAPRARPPRDSARVSSRTRSRKASPRPRDAAAGRAGPPRGAPEAGLVRVEQRAGAVHDVVQHRLRSSCPVSSWVTCRSARARATSRRARASTRALFTSAPSAPVTVMRKGSCSASSGARSGREMTSTPISSEPARSGRRSSPLAAGAGAGSCTGDSAMDCTVAGSSVAGGATRYPAWVSRRIAPCAAR